MSCSLELLNLKICRGDVWGYETLLGYLKSLSNSLYQVDSPGAPPDSMPFSLCVTWSSFRTMHIS